MTRPFASAAAGGWPGRAPRGLPLVRKPAENPAPAGSAIRPGGMPPRGTGFLPRAGLRVLECRERFR